MLLSVIFFLILVSIDDVIGKKRKPKYKLPPYGNSRISI